MRLSTAIATVFLVSGCEDVSGLNGSPSMNPGQDCMTCHIANGQASGRLWTIAGTAYPSPMSPADGGLEGAEVLIEEVGSPDGGAPKAITLRTDAVGNFYTQETFVGAVRVAVQYANQRYQMQETPPTGACNLCHNLQASTTGVLTPIQLPVPYLDAGFDYGAGAPGRVFVPTGRDAG